MSDGKPDPLWPGSEQYQPASHVSLHENPPDTRIMTAHLPTPETATTTHYFIHYARNFAAGDAAVAHFLHEHLTAAFTGQPVRNLAHFGQGGRSHAPLAVK